MATNKTTTAQEEVKVQPQLLDLLHAVPRVLERLPMNDFRSLAATSKVFRQVLQQQVTRLRTGSCFCIQEDTAPFLVSGAWTQLQHLTIGYMPFLHQKRSIHAILQADWPALRTLDLQDIALTDDAISLLVARPWPALSCLILTGTRLSATGCHRLLTGQWPLLRSLSLGWNRLDASFFKQMVEGSRLLHLTELHLPGIQLNKAAAIELVQYGAPLQTLSLEWNRLPASVMSVLSQAKWRVEVLNISACEEVDVEAIRCLARAEWPRLSTLNVAMIGGDAVGHALSVDVFCQANWPLLTVLDVSDNPLSADAVAHLAKSMTLLRKINLTNCGLTVAACSALQHAAWPLLETLVLQYNNIDVAGIQCLVGARFPLLRRLLLKDNDLNKSALQTLSMGDWPDLEELEVSHSSDATGVTSLAHGRWCKLRVLRLFSINEITQDILKALLNYHEPLWHVLSGVATPVARIDSEATFNILQHSFACLELRPVSFPLLENLYLSGFTNEAMATVEVDFGRLVYYPWVSVSLR